MILYAIANEWLPPVRSHISDAYNIMNPFRGRYTKVQEPLSKSLTYTLMGLASRAFRKPAAAFPDYRGKNFWLTKYQGGNHCRKLSSFGYTFDTWPSDSEGLGVTNSYVISNLSIKCALGPIRVRHHEAASLCRCLLLLYNIR